MATNLLFIYIALILFANSCSSSTLIGNNTFYSATLGFPKVDGKGINDPFEMQGLLMLADPRKACTFLNVNATGQILIIDPDDCFIETKMKNAQDAGASGVIIFQDDGLGQYTFTNNLKPLQINIRAVEIAKIHLPLVLELIKSNGTVNAFINSDMNEWIYYASNRAWIAFSVLMALTNAVLVILCAYKWFQYPTKITKACYSLIIIGASIRIITAIDYHGAMWIYSFSIRTALVTLSFPFAMASTLVIGFYWLETFHKKGLQTSIIKLKNYAPHFAIVITLLFATEIITSSMRASLIIPAALAFITVTAYMITYIFTLVFFSYACYILKKESSKFQASSTLKHLFRMGIAQCLCLVAFIIITIIIYLPGVKNTMTGILTSPIAQVAMSIYCFIQTIMFKNPNKNGSHGSSSPKATQSKYPKTSSEAFTPV